MYHSKDYSNSLNETLSEQRDRILKKLFSPEWFIKREIFLNSNMNNTKKQLKLF